MKWISQPMIFISPIFCCYISWKTWEGRIFYIIFFFLDLSLLFFVVGIFNVIIIFAYSFLVNCELNKYRLNFLKYKYRKIYLETGRELEWNQAFFITLTHACMHAPTHAYTYTHTHTHTSSYINTKPNQFA